MGKHEAGAESASPGAAVPRWQRNRTPYVYAAELRGTEARGWQVDSITKGLVSVTELWRTSAPRDFVDERFLDIIGVAPTSEPAIGTGSALSIPFYGEFRYCGLKSARGGYNDCSQVPAEQIVDYHSCASDHARMVFTKRNW